MRTIKTVCDRCGFDNTVTVGGPGCPPSDYANQSTPRPFLHEGVATLEMSGFNEKNSRCDIHVCVACVKYVRENLGAILMKGLKRD